MRNNPLNKFKDYLSLSKIKIMIPVSLTGFTGYFFYNPHFTSRLFVSSIGIFLLAVSASVLNQIQEIDPDLRMIRTHLRPLPAKRISPAHASVFCVLSMAAGMAILYLTGNIRACLIGLFTILWYNGVYTYLKRITPFAVVPGAITGALPPLIGWVAAGGLLFDKQIMFIQFLIFMGQIPHFWLLILKYGNDYKQAGFPTITDVFNDRQINRITFSWVISSVLSALFLCYFEIIKNQIIIIVLAIASAIIIWRFLDLLKYKDMKNNQNKYSIFLDSYFLLILLLLISDKILN